ncbi:MULTISPECIES: DUF4956 domain-containing protein [Microbacterium]|uniref:DUF4956 domain-containing protein n=1 Tax=Microbacterium TaxID=33882 RepID=UPI00217D4C7D|nr:MULTISPECIES: DUF4956 domain-containing protein [Microbacterium]UWF76715.1 DUF4956 domain-containing protein [Microbacterium neungamense]WCM54865.1 DUF4956 domain-containing protein [Microbacterium sp. EF45047]
MSLLVPILTDLVAIVLLAYALYFRRHRRRDLLLSYVALNVGVLAVTIAMSSVPVSVGLGMGLFGILSIIRLRSDQITQQEIAYYFVALALGLLAGLRPAPEWMTPALSALMLGVMLVADSRWTAARTRHHTLVLDRAYTDERQLTDAVTRLLDASVLRVEVRDLDLVRDTTLVDVRYRVRAARPASVRGGTGSRPAIARTERMPEEALA